MNVDSGNSRFRATSLAHLPPVGKASGVSARTVTIAPPKSPAAGPAQAMATANAATIDRLSKSLRAMTPTRLPSAHALASQARAQQEFQKGACTLLQALVHGPDNKVTGQTATELIELAGKMRDVARTSGTNTLDTFSGMSDKDATGALFRELKNRLATADFSSAIEGLPAAVLPQLGTAARLLGKDIDSEISGAAKARFNEMRHQVKQELTQILNGSLTTQTPHASALDQLQAPPAKLKQALASHHQALGKSFPTQDEADSARDQLLEEIFKGDKSLSEAVSTQLRSPQWHAVADTLEQAGASREARETGGPKSAATQRMLSDAALIRLVAAKADAHAGTPLASSHHPPTADGLSWRMQEMLTNRYGCVPTLTGHANKGKFTRAIQNAVLWQANACSEFRSTARLPKGVPPLPGDLTKLQRQSASHLVQGNAFAALKKSLGTADSPIRRHDGKPGILRGGVEHTSYQFEKQKDGSLLVHCSYSITKANHFRPADGEVHSIDPATGNARFTVTFQVGEDGVAKVAEPMRFDCGSIRRHEPSREELLNEAIALSVAPRWREMPPDAIAPEGATAVRKP